MNQTGKNSEAVKYRLSEAMKKCMEYSSVEKISVKEITQKCGVTRQTFYRNFRDKYDLINWYFGKILEKSYEQLGEGKTVYEGLVRKFRCISSEESFFREAFKNDNQNCLREYDYQESRRYYREELEKKRGKKLSGDLDFQLEMYTRGCVHMTVQWVLGNRPSTPEKLAEQLTDAIPQKLGAEFRSARML